MTAATPRPGALRLDNAPYKREGMARWQAAAVAQHLARQSDALSTPARAERTGPRTRPLEVCMTRTASAPLSHIRPVTRLHRLSAPLMGLGFTLALIGAMSLHVPTLLLGAGLFGLGVKATGRAGEYVDLGRVKWE